MSSALCLQKNENEQSTVVICTNEWPTLVICTDYYITIEVVILCLPWLSFPC